MPRVRHLLFDTEAERIGFEDASAGEAPDPWGMFPDVTRAGRALRDGYLRGFEAFRNRSRTHQRYDRGIQPSRAARNAPTVT